MEEKLVTIVIPAYNRENLIFKAVNSVLQQTYPNIEVIVVDDCSKDNTVEVLQSIKDKRLTVYRLPENSGACYARNYGADRSHGVYIAFHDSDDIWHLDKLEKQLVYLEKTGADFVFCAMNRILKNRSFIYPKNSLDFSGNVYRQLLIENRIATQTMLMKREVFEKTRFDESFRRFQDWDFAVRVSRQFTISYLNETLVDSAVQGNSISVNVKNFDAWNALYEKYHDDISADLELNYIYLNRLFQSIKAFDNKLSAYYLRQILGIKWDLKKYTQYTLSKLDLLSKLYN